MGDQSPIDPNSYGKMFRHKGKKFQAVAFRVPGFAVSRSDPFSTDYAFGVDFTFIGPGIPGVQSFFNRPDRRIERHHQSDKLRLHHQRRHYRVAGVGRTVWGTALLTAVPTRALACGMRARVVQRLALERLSSNARSVCDTCVRQRSLPCQP